MGLACKEVALSEAAAKALAELEGPADPRAKSAARRARKLRGVLLADCLHGEVVKKGRIPKVLAAQYPLTNLYVTFQTTGGFSTPFRTAERTDLSS